MLNHRCDAPFNIGNTIILFYKDPLLMRVFLFLFSILCFCFLLPHQVHLVQDPIAFGYDATAATYLILSPAPKKLKQFSLPVQIKKAGSQVENKVEHYSVPKRVVPTAKISDIKCKWD